MLKRRQLLTALPVLAAVLALPQLVRAAPLPHEKLADIYYMVERWDLRVEAVYVGKELFRELATIEGVDPIGPTVFLLWGARFVMSPVKADRVYVRADGRRPGEARMSECFQHFFFSWDRPAREGERTYWDTFTQEWRHDAA